MEYLLVVGLSMLLIIPTIAIFATQSISLREDIASAQVERIGQELLGSAEEVYYLGPPTQKEVIITLPEGVTNISIDGQEIVFQYHYDGGIFTYPLYSELPLNLSGNITRFQGLHTITVKAEETGIVISEGS